MILKLNEHRYCYRKKLTLLLLLMTWEDSVGGRYSVVIAYVLCMLS